MMSSRFVSGMKGYDGKSCKESSVLSVIFKGQPALVGSVYIKIDEAFVHVAVSVSKDGGDVQVKDYS